MKAAVCLKMSLETREFTVVDNGITTKVPALSQKWCEKKRFLKWILPVQSTTAYEEEWKEIMNLYNADLRWLLGLPHHKFWSQMVHDKSLHGSLVSFLQEAPRFYSDDVDRIKALNAWELYQETYRLVFLCFLRIATHKESKEDYVSSQFFGSLLYDNFLFDIPKIMDLCIIFGSTNHNLLSKMINNIFSHQPKYLEDLKEAAKGISQVCDSLLSQLGLDEKQAVGLNNQSPLSTTEFEDIIEYMVDIAATIWYFVDMYQPAADVFSKANIQTKLIDLYEKSVPYLFEQLESRESSEQTKLLNGLNTFRKYLLQDYNILLHSASVRPLLNDNNVDKQSCVECWLEWLTLAITERHFIVDYNQVFPIQDDIDLMAQMSISIDKTRVDYIRNGVRTVIAEFGLDRHSPSRSEPSRSNDRVELAIESLINQVKELLPDLQDDFVEACLKHYDFEAETVINSILENNLAPHLIEMQNGTRIEDSMESAYSVIEPPPTIINKEQDISKKSRTKTVHFDEVKDTLDKPSEKRSLKNAILERVVEHDAFEYDDEYDDTYDEHDMGAEEPDAYGELESRRSFVVPRILRPKEERELEEEDEEEDVEPDDKPRDQFVPNPAELREKAEQRRLSRGGRSVFPIRSAQDVVGAPRGQGQDKNTVIARRRKAENKSRGANHNRRNQADRKRKEF